MCDLWVVPLKGEGLHSVVPLSVGWNVDMMADATAVIVDYKREAAG